MQPTKTRLLADSSVVQKLICHVHVTLCDDYVHRLIYKKAKAEETYGVDNIAYHGNVSLQCSPIQTNPAVV